MAACRALLVLVLALASLQAAFGGGFGACHTATPRAAESPSAAEAMPCHQAQGEGSPAQRAGGGDDARVSMRSADCCAAHPACGACSAQSFAIARSEANARRPGTAAQAAVAAPAEVACDGRTLDHIPL
jgi:hypothetical protein